MIQPLSAGNALRLFLAPPGGSVRWKILRKGSGTFSGMDDPSAILAYEGSDKVVVDAEFLQNSVMAFYKPYYTADGVTWTPGAVASGTPVAAFADNSTDVLNILRARIEAGLKVEVDRGVIAADLGYVQVYTAPPSVEHDLRFPLVTLHQTSEDPEGRGIGEMITNDSFNATDGQWTESEGWMARVQIEFLGWSLNPDERIQLRKSLRTVLISNLPVFDAAGMVEITFSMSDIDAVSGEYSSPMYQVSGNFTCMAPVIVSNKNDLVIVGVELTATPL